MGGVGSQEITRVWQAVLAGFGACLVLHTGWGRAQLRNSGFCRTSVLERAIPPARSLKPDNSILLHVSLVLIKLLSLFWSSEWVFVSERVCVELVKWIPVSVTPSVSPD